MNSCQNCGKLNTPDTKFCRFCGTKFTEQRPQTATREPYDFAAPRPYAWKTDEFQTDSRQTLPIQNSPSTTTEFDRANPNFRPAPLSYQQPGHLNQPYRCPNCMSSYPPVLEQRISTGGWITFAVLLVVFFPLFWIGLLIKEDVPVCPSCNMKLN